MGTRWPVPPPTRVSLFERRELALPHECLQLMRSLEPRLQRTVISAPERPNVVTGRKSDGCLLGAGDLSESLRDRLAMLIVFLTNASETQIEPWQAVRFEQGCASPPHYDFFIDKDPSCKWQLSRGGQRTHTIMLHLNAAIGGETYFPRLQQYVVPEIGKFVCWNNTDEAGRPVQNSQHLAHAPVTGQRWALVTWVRERDFE